MAPEQSQTDPRAQSYSRRAACPINGVACSTPKPALLLTYLLITMESSIPIVLTLRDGANTPTNVEKCFECGTKPNSAYFVGMVDLSLQRWFTKCIMSL